MAKLKSRSQEPTEKDGEFFKQQIEPAAWVSVGQIEVAKQVYISNLTAHRAVEQGGKKVPADIVPYPVRLRGIEGLVTDQALKAFWEKAGEYYVINTISGLYIKYFEPLGGQLGPHVPRISKAKRDKRLDKIAKYLERIFRDIGTDPSVATCFQTAFYDALPSGPFVAENPSNPGRFLSQLYENVSGKGQNSCRRMKTHDALPRSMKEGDKNERGRFMHGISQLVYDAYKRTNHVMAARILNIVRPDLGGFTDDNVRKYLVKNPIAEW